VRNSQQNSIVKEFLVFVAGISTKNRPVLIIATPNYNQSRNSPFIIDTHLIIWILIYNHLKD